jgi:hypothetical protein
MRVFYEAGLYYGIVNPTGGTQSDVDWTRLAACQDLAPHGGVPAAVESYSSYCSLQDFDSIRHLL